MELALRVIATAPSAGLPTALTASWTATESVAGSSGAGVAVAALCGAVFLAFGIAHYRGFVTSLSDRFVFGPYVGLAMGWLGGGALLAALSYPLLNGERPVAATVVGVLVVLAALVCWVVGLVGVFWLPRALRPRWLRERLGQDDPPGTRDERQPWTRGGRG